MLAQQHRAGEKMGEGDSTNDGRHGSEDSGYFSRRSSKAISIGAGRRDSILLQELGETVEMIEKEDDKHDDNEGAEEADDEGAGLEDLEEDEDADGEPRGTSVPTKTDSHHAMENNDKEQTPAPAQTAATSEHPNQIPPQSRLGTRFISPRKPAQPLLDTDDARTRYTGFGQ